MAKMLSELFERCNDTQYADCMAGEVRLQSAMTIGRWFATWRMIPQCRARRWTGWERRLRTCMV